ncbi:MAG: hypothetical protein ACJ796_09960 [Gemmatimonadaceae bacterium]
MTEATEHKQSDTRINANDTPYRDIGAVGSEERVSPRAVDSVA